MNVCLTTSCARYEAHPLIKLHIPEEREREEPIIISLTKLDKKKCLYHLGRDVIRKGFQPIQITVYNNSENPLILLREGIDIASKPAEVVASRVTTTTALRVVSYGAVSIFIWPFLIPAVIDGIKSFKANQELLYDYTHKSINVLEIPPYTTKAGLLFIPIHEMKQSISIEFIDRNSHETRSYSLSFPDERN